MNEEGKRKLKETCRLHDCRLQIMKVIKGRVWTKDLDGGTRMNLKGKSDEFSMRQACSNLLGSQ
eukprot:12424253-Karenia_brevis.AAC.1